MGRVTVPCALRHISRATKVETARPRKIKKKARKTVSTVRIAAASIAVKPIIVRNR